MLDLNEVPDQLFSDACVEDAAAAPSCVPIAVTGSNVPEEISVSCLSVPLPSSSSKDDGQHTAVEEGASVVQNTLSKGPTPSSLSSEVASSEQRNDIIASTAHKQDAPTSGVFDIAHATEDLGLNGREEARQAERNASNELNPPSDDRSKDASHFFGGNAGDASNFRPAELSASPISIRKQENARAETILSTNVEFDRVVESERSGLCLSIGGIFNKPFERGDSLFPSKSTPNIHSGNSKPELLALLPGINSDLSPFWLGKLCVSDASIKARVLGYVFGPMTPDSRLKKLPSTLSPKKFLNREELEKAVNKGLVEPFMQFKLSSEASSEEMNVFSSLVDSLSCGWKPLQSSFLSGPVSYRQGLLGDGHPTSSAALISWDGDSSDVKFYLIPILGMPAVLKLNKLSGYVDVLEGLEELDPASLYGVFCHGASGALDRSHDCSPRLERADKTSLKQTERVTEDGAIFAKTAGTTVIASLSLKDRSTAKLEIFSMNEASHPNRCLKRDDCNPDSDGVVKGFKRHYEKQVSLLDRVGEATGKYHSRDNTSHDVDEDEKGNRIPGLGRSKQREKLNNAARQSFRQELQDDRLKAPPRHSRDDKENRQRVKEHHRHRDEDKDKLSKFHEAVDRYHVQDKPQQNEKERLTSEIAMEGSRLKSVTDKNSFGSKNKPPLGHRSSPDCDSVLSSRKRDRDDERERAFSGKRQRDLGLNNAGQLRNDSRKTNEGIVNPMNDQISAKESGSFKFLDSSKCNMDLQTLGIFHENPATRVGATDTDAHILDASLALPEAEDGMVDDGLNMNKQPSEIPDPRSPISLRLFMERSGLPDHGSSSKVLDNLLSEKGAEGNDTSLEFLLDVPDKETRTWLLSKQNASYIEEEYGVCTVVTSDLVSTEVDVKIDSQTGPLTVRVSCYPLVPSDSVEDKWFLEQASAAIRSIASKGVFIKCLWYEGPVQIHSGDGAPSVPVIVRKIKGEDGKNLERIQDLTGVMIGVVLKRCGSGPTQETELTSRPRFIGLRLKCVRRKGLLDASKEAEALLESVADHFSKELATHIATHIVDLQASALQPCEATSNQSSPLVSSIATRELLPNLPVKDESCVCPCKANVTAVPAVLPIMDSKIDLPKEDSNGNLSTAAVTDSSRSLYVTNLPVNITPTKIQNIFETVLREKLSSRAEVNDTTDLVVDVTFKPEMSCALVLLVNDSLVNASINLYEEDRNVFKGMRIELGSRECQGSLTRNGARSRDFITLAKREEESISRRQGEVDNDYDSECSRDKWVTDNLQVRADSYPGRPKPLFLTELMRNASGPLIKQLFEEVIARYLSPNLVRAGGRQLVLDVRYVPSRGCAFVDLATPELVEFMLDLHSQRPDVFKNMKMERGRKPVPYAVEEDCGGKVNLRLHGNSHFSSQTFGYRRSLASRKIVEKRMNGSLDLEDSDKGDDLQWLSSRTKKQRSDPEKTIYVDRLPENASEGTIKKIFERVLAQKVAREELEAMGELITEVRHVPSKYCAFVVFATEDLTRTVLHLYNLDEEIFESMRLKPHFHSRMEDQYKDELQEIDEISQMSSPKEKVGSLETDNSRLRQLDLQDSRSKSAAHRAITASAFREVDRRRSVYVDRIPEDLSESTMTEMFEVVFRFKKHGYEGRMVSKVAYFRDKFDQSKLCAFVEVKTERGTQDLVDYYNANLDAFRGMRVRPGFKYHS